MAPKFLCKSALSALSVSLAVSLSGAAAARAELPSLTLHVLGTNEAAVRTANARVAEGPTADSEIHLVEERQWFGVNLDVRLRLFSLNLGASQGSLREVHFDESPTVDLRSIRSAPLRYLTLSALYHPIPASAGRRVDLFFGPTAGMAYYTRAFASSESRSVSGGKLGFDVHLGDTNWLTTVEASVLRSHIHVFANSKDQKFDYALFAAGLGYHW